MGWLSPLHLQRSNQLIALVCVTGIKADALRAQGGGEQYNPVGVGTAWSHNFL